METATFEALLADVAEGRKTITRVTHECTGRGAITVTFSDSEEVDVTTAEARELALATRGARGSDDLEWLADALD